MNKPVKPKKKVLFPRSKTFEFNHASKKVSLLRFLDWCYAQLPKKAVDVTLELREDIDYTDEGDFSSFFTYLELAWEEEGDNPDYDNDMIKYKKKLDKWKRLNK